MRIPKFSKKKKGIQSQKFTPVIKGRAEENKASYVLNSNKMLTEPEMKKFMERYSKISPAKAGEVKLYNSKRDEIVNDVMREINPTGTTKQEINDIRSQAGEAFKKLIQAQMKHGKTIEEVFYNSDNKKIKEYIKNSLGII